MIGYKLINIQNSKYMSYCSGVGRIEYFMDKFVKPKKDNGPLALFPTFEAAEEFFLSDTSQMSTINWKYEQCYAIFKVEYTKSRYHKLWYPLVMISGKIITSYCGWEPPTTVYASSVKLLELVKEYKQGVNDEQDKSRL